MTQSENLEQNQDMFNKYVNMINQYIQIIIYNIFKFLSLLNEMAINFYDIQKNYLVKKYLNETINKIDYIDLDNNKIVNIYDTNLLNNIILVLLNHTIRPYTINSETLFKLAPYINSKNNCYLNISYYSDMTKYNSLINISNFKRENNNYLFKSVDVLILNIIGNFIINNVLVTKDDITYVEIQTTEKINITQIFRNYQNSFKENNITLQDFILILRTLAYKKDLDINELNDIKLVITDSELDDKKYNMSDFINFKTLYQELADK